MTVRIPNKQFATFYDREFVLTDLVTLGKIRIEVILASEYRTRCNGRIHRQPELGRHSNDFGIQYRQHTRVAEVDEAGLRVGICPIRGRGARKYLRVSRKLDMNLKSDDYFPLAAHSKPPGQTLCQSVICWYWCAQARMDSSEKWAPTNCSPTGKSPAMPHGMEIPGRPARFAPIV